MRFLHTADWHVGKPLRGRSRLDEQGKALDQVLAIALDAKVDAVLVAGDLFDGQAPAPEAERLVYDFLARLAREKVGAVLIAGNHDHPKKLGALAGLLEGLGIHVRSEVRPAAQGGVVTLGSRDGREQAQVAVLPFVAERKIVEASDLFASEDAWYEKYADRIERVLETLTGGFGVRTVNVVIAHLLIEGARVGTGERPLHLGEIYGVNAQQLPPGAHYIGLGHLHRPQEIEARSRTFYAGSLIELDFGEKEQDKRVVVFEARPGKPATVESMPITAGRRLRDVGGTLEELRRLAGTTGGDFLRVRVKVDAPVPGIAEQVKELLPDALEVQLDYERSTIEVSQARLGLQPKELFTGFYQQKNGAAPGAELLALFDEVYEEAARA